MKRFISICTLAAAVACTAAPAEPESSSSAAYKVASTTAEAQQQAVQLMRDISEAQASAIDQLYADSSEMDPPNPTDALVLAIAAAVIDYSFAQLADRAVTAVVTHFERSEEDAAATIIRAAFGDLAGKAGERVKGKMDGLINGYRYSPMISSQRRCSTSRICGSSSDAIAALATLIARSCGRVRSSRLPRKRHSTKTSPWPNRASSTSRSAAPRGKTRWR